MFVGQGAPEGERPGEGEEQQEGEQEGEDEGAARQHQLGLPPAMLGCWEEKSELKIVALLSSPTPRRRPAMCICVSVHLHALLRGLSLIVAAAVGVFKEGMLCWAMGLVPDLQQLATRHDPKSWHHMVVVETVC